MLEHDFVRSVLPKQKVLGVIQPVRRPRSHVLLKAFGRSPVEAKDGIVRIDELAKGRKEGASAVSPPRHNIFLL